MLIINIIKCKNNTLQIMIFITIYSNIQFNLIDDYINHS